MTAYIILYILSPYLNLFLHSMSRELYRKFLMTLLMLYSVLPTIFGLFYNTTESLLYYNRLIWLVIMYCIGAYIHLHKSVLIRTMKNAVMISIISFMIIAISILFMNRYADFFSMIGTTEIAYFWTPNAVPMVVLSIGIFGVFLHLDIPYNPWMNKVASTTLGIYLLHDNSVLTSWLWGTVVQCASYSDSPYLVFRILGASIAIFFIGMVIDLCRKFLETCILKGLFVFRPSRNVE